MGDSKSRCSSAVESDLTGVEITVLQHDLHL